MAQSIVEGRSRRVRAVAALVLVFFLVGVTACGDDDTAGDDADNGPAEVAESAAARVVAEALRVVVVEDDGPATDRRKVDVLQESVDDLPGTPDVSGIVDDDGDGLDDDGNVDVHVNGETACLSVADDGDVSVTGGSC
jgi:hypothetical protein